MTLIADRIRQTIEVATWAPSGDNTQPWYFTMRGVTLRTHLIPELDNPILNFKLSGTYIAHGALVENLILAAPLAGLSAQARLMPDAEDPYCTAEIIFADSTETPDSLANAILERHTNRKTYLSRAVDAATVNVLRDAVKQVPDVACSFLTDTSSIRAVAQVSALMEQIALEIPELRKLFFSDILWTDEENRAGKPGLYIKTMELPSPVRMLFKYLRNASFAEFMNRLGFSKAARATNAKLYASAPLLCLVSMREESPQAYLSVGRATERLWLAATEHGLAFQPVTGLLFLARSIANGAGGPLLAEHFEAINGADQTIRSAFELKPGEISGMMFRIGYAPAPTDRSFRHAPDIR